MSKLTLISRLGLVSVSILVLGVAVPTWAYTGQNLEKTAKVKLIQAREIALRAHAGKITDEELEQEKGGSGLRYSFDIKDGNAVFEVGVDANSGKVLENAKEGPNPD